MANARAKELIDLGSRLFEKKRGFDGLCQEIARIFYPERANFTETLALDEDFAGTNMDGHPQLLRRELGNSMSATLRPRDQPWFAATTGIDDLDGVPEVAEYLEYVTLRMRRALYDKRTGFVKATKQGDHDYVTFGQTVLSVEEEPEREHLFFRCHHLRDCAWLENHMSVIDHLHRNDTMNARSQVRRFGEKAVHQSVRKALEKEPGRDFRIRCIVMPADEYDLVGGSKKLGGKERKLPFVVIYVDIDNQHILREGGLPIFNYCVPRWHMLSDSPYAFSPATVTALPDGRMAQALARILLEAGEKAVDPPMVATEEAVREVNLQAGALSWIDMDYDERLGAALRPIEIKGDMRTGFALRQDVRDMLAKAFFIDKLALPEAGKQMTAYEIRTRLEEHVRNLLPLFEPMEVEYNMGVLDRSFDLMRIMNQFDVESMPDVLSGKDITWQFKNPMQEASTRVMVEQFNEAVQIENVAAQAGVSVRRLDVARARDDALRGSGGPARWRRIDTALADEEKALAAKAKIAAAGQEIASGAAVAGEVGGAVKQMQEAGLLPAPADATARPLPPNVRPTKQPGQKPMLRLAA